MEGWTSVNIGEPPDDALVIFYIPSAKYVWGTGLDLPGIKIEYPTVSHWRIISLAP